jgi:hypothetical protein
MLNLVTVLSITQTVVVSLYKQPRRLQDAISSTNSNNLCLLLHVGGYKCRSALSKLLTPILAALIQRVIDTDIVLSAQVVSNLKPSAKHAVAAALSEPIKSKLLKTIDCLQQICELKFTHNGKFRLDSHVITGR